MQRKERFFGEGPCGGIPDSLHGKLLFCLLCCLSLGPFVRSWQFRMNLATQKMGESYPTIKSYGFLGSGSAGTLGFGGSEPRNRTCGLEFLGLGFGV